MHSKFLPIVGVAALWSLIPVATADWILDSNTKEPNSAACQGVGGFTVGGVPSDDEINQLCDKVLGDACNNQIVDLSANGQGSLVWAPRNDGTTVPTCVDKTPANQPQCFATVQGCVSGNIPGGPKAGVICEVNDSAGDFVGSVASNGECLPGAPPPKFFK